MLTDGFSIQPLKVELLAGEQKATEDIQKKRPTAFEHLTLSCPASLAFASQGSSLMQADVSVISWPPLLGLPKGKVFGSE